MVEINNNNNNTNQVRRPNDEHDEQQQQLIKQCQQQQLIQQHCHRHDRLIAYQRACRTDAPRLWRTLPRTDRHDKEFVVTTLQRASTLPPKSEFERPLSQSLRFDRDVVLAFGARRDFPQLFVERHLYVPECLTNDKEVMLTYCRQIPRSLQECSDELIDDEQVVQAAIELDGLELQYASLRLQEDETMIKSACRQNGRALEYCPPGPLRDKLTSDREFMRQVVQAQGGSMLRLAAEFIRNDPELVLAALSHGGMRWRDCPRDLQHDHEFITQALTLNPNLYLELPKARQSVPELAMTAVLADASTAAVHQRAWESSPDLLHNRAVVCAIAQRGTSDFVRKMFQELMPVAFQLDEEIVLLVLRRDPNLFFSLATFMQRQPAIILAAMHFSTAVDVLRVVDASTQQAHPEIVVQAISCAPHGTMRFFRTHVQPATLWSHKPIALAWIRRGNRVLDHFGSDLLNDPEVALEIAQYSWMEFHHVSDDLRQNVNFMLQAVERNGRVLRFAQMQEQHNMELVIRAIANTPDAIVSSRIPVDVLLRHIQERLDLHQLFVRDFLRGIAIVPSPLLFTHHPRRCLLPLLNRGLETSQALKQLIADFLGVPRGADLRWLRQAHRHLTQRPVAAAAAAAALYATSVDWDTLHGDNNNNHEDDRVNDNDNHDRPHGFDLAGLREPLGIRDHGGGVVEDAFGLPVAAAAAAGDGAPPEMRQHIVGRPFQVPLQELVEDAGLADHRLFLNVHRRMAPLRRRRLQNNGNEHRHDGHANRDHQRNVDIQNEVDDNLFDDDDGDDDDDIFELNNEIELLAGVRDDVVLTMMEEGDERVPWLMPE